MPRPPAQHRTVMQPRPIASSLLAALAAATAAPAQLPLSFVFSFTDTTPGGTGNIGVTQDEVGFDYYLVAFQNVQNVHTFDPAGQPLSTFTSTGCSPALPSPNDITYDPFTTDLWLVDNNGSNVLRMSRQGTCLGGFPMPQITVNAVGICVDRNHGTLFVSHVGAVGEYDFAGNVLGGGFSFTPPSGSNILSGITYVPSTDRFLITQSGGSTLYEVDRTGALLSTTALGPFGIGNTQGLHYNPALQTLVVVDNSQSTAYVFSLPFCAGTTVHRGIGCADGGGSRLVLGGLGCADLGATLTLEALSSPNPLPMLFAGGMSDTSFGGIALPLDLASFGGVPGCFLYTSSEAIVTAPVVGNVATLPFSIPNTPGLSGTQVFLQALEFDPTLGVALPLASSNQLALTIF